MNKETGGPAFPISVSQEEAMRRDEVIEIARRLGWNVEHEATNSMLRRFTQEVARQCAEIADTAEPYKSADLIRKHFGVDETEKAMQEVQRLGEEIQPDFAYSADYDAYYYIDTGEWVDPVCNDKHCHFCNTRPAKMQKENT